MIFLSAIYEIDILRLCIGILALAIPSIVFILYKTGLFKTLWVSVSRMLVQLSLVALYLEYIFELNSALLNITWVVLMIIIAGITTVKRASLPARQFVLPVIASILISLFVIDTFFLGFIVQLEYLFDARYFIPITGMLIGNSINTNIIALNTYYTQLAEKKIMYCFLLANGASQHEALSLFIRESLRKALNPSLANMSVMGLITLPGMMTGQILGGSSPATAIKYQIMIMVSIMVASTSTITLTLLFSNKSLFNGMGMIKEIAPIKPLKKIRSAHKRS